MSTNLPASTIATMLRGAAACALQAPSTHNTQPWRFRIHDGALEISYDETRRLTVIDPERRQLVMSCGCALYNARLAVRAAGFREHVTTFPDPERPELVAVLRPGLARSPTVDDLGLLAAIARRHTNRAAFLDRPVSEALSAALAREARAQRIWFARLQPAQKHRLGSLVAEADRRQLDDPAYLAELGQWLVPIVSLRRDGIPFAEKEYGVPTGFGVMRRLRAPGLAAQFAELERERIRTAPLIAVLASDGDEPIDWLDCGQAIEAVLLRATRFGLAASFLNQVLEVPRLANEVDRVFDREVIAQMVLRIGFASEEPGAVPRRELDGLLVEE